MRVGTWNLDGKWSQDHAAVLQGLDCDVLLLTECVDEVSLPGFSSVFTSGRMSGPEGQRWAAVLTTADLLPLREPHPAAAAAQVQDLVLCASVLPWPRAGTSWPWGSSDHTSRFRETTERLRSEMPAGNAVWGGDWNQPLEGDLSGFSRAARDTLLTAVSDLDLQVPTARLPGRPAGQRSIDHVAVPASWTVDGAGRVAVARRLSDHDAYWVSARPPQTPS